MRRKETKREAVQVAETLIDLAVATAPTDMDLARAQASLARKIMLKFNIRYDWHLRRFFCHGCKGLLYPGVNARVRLGPGKTLLVTCGDCGHVNRKKIPSHA